MAQPAPTFDPFLLSKGVKRGFDYAAEQLKIDISAGQDMYPRYSPRQFVVKSRIYTDYLPTYGPLFQYLESLEVDPSNRIGLADLQFPEELIAQHHTHEPKVPGVLMLEAVQQLGACLLMTLAQGEVSGQVTPVVKEAWPMNKMVLGMNEQAVAYVLALSPERRTGITPLVYSIIKPHLPEGNQLVGYGYIKGAAFVDGKRASI